MGLATFPVTCQADVCYSQTSWFILNDMFIP